MPFGFFILTLGCQMNKSDSERLTAALQRQGGVLVSEATAEVLVVNSCSVRQTAMDRVHSALDRWKTRQQNKPEILTVLTGCVLPQDKQFFADRFDLIVGIGQWRRLQETLQERFGADTAAPLLSLQTEVNDYLSTMPQYRSPFSAYVPISTGCNKFCTYCAVPYTRGREWSRPAAQVLGEITQLAEQGWKEIILLGQTVNSYQPTDAATFSVVNPYSDPFAALLWEINNIPGIDRVFFTAPHPSHLTEQQITALTLPVLVNFLHLPVQAGSDEILRRMNRPYTTEAYITLVDRIRQTKPDIAVATDIIVGFSGETAEQFQQTVELYQRCQFDISYTAKYSTRVGTLADRKFIDDVSPAEKKRRWEVLHELMESITLEKNQRYLNQVVSVLVDSYQHGSCHGNSREMKRVEFPGTADQVGTVVSVKIDQPLCWVLRGRAVEA